jgi:hypothetical protein
MFARTSVAVCFVLIASQANAQFDLGKLKNALDKAQKNVEGTAQPQAQAVPSDKATSPPTAKTAPIENTTDGLTQVNLELKGIKPNMSTEAYAKVFSDVGLRCTISSISQGSPYYRFGDKEAACEFYRKGERRDSKPAVFSVFGIPVEAPNEQGWSANFLENRLTRVQIGYLNSEHYARKDIEAMVVSLTEKFQTPPKTERTAMESRRKGPPTSFQIYRTWKNKNDSSQFIISSEIHLTDCSQFIKRDADVCEAENAQVAERQVSFILVTGNIEQIAASQEQRKQRDAQSREAASDAKRKKDF